MILSSIQQHGFTKRQVLCLRALQIILAAMLFCGSVGCVVRQGRDYGHVLFRPSPFFRVQLLQTSETQDEVLEIGDLLLLPPVGEAPSDIVREFPLLMWQELQQVLAGAVRMPRPGGIYVQYADVNNLVSDHGRVHTAELARIGFLSGASHVLLPKIVDYRAYHPQRITMELLLLRVSDQSVAMVIVGSLDASEQRVLMAADSYLRHRKATPYDTANLDMLLRSPRAFTGFAMHEVVLALRGKVIPEREAGFKVFDVSTDLAHRDRE